MQVSIGTEDADFLCHRARQGVTLPARWEHELSQRSTVEYIDNGLALHLPRLRRGERCEVHFAAAWADRQGDDSATWFAVDTDPRRHGPAWARAG